MYYAAWGSINKIGMDGSNKTTLVTGQGLIQPWGVTIDFSTSKIFWADRLGHRIESSNLDGDERTVVNSAENGPHGVAVLNGRIYWGEHRNKRLESSTIEGKDVITFLTEVDYIKDLTVVPDLSLPQNRTNHCAKQNCDKVCVLTAASYRCLT